MSILTSLRRQSGSLVRHLSTREARNSDYAPAPDVLWWRFDEGGGTAIADLSSAGNAPGTISNSAAHVSPGANGGGECIQGNASSYYASSNADLALLGSSIITVAFWFNTSTFAGATRFFLELSASISANLGMAVYSDSGALGINMSNASGLFAFGSLASTPSINTWHHILIVANRVTNTPVVYVDGGEVTFSGFTNQFTANSTVWEDKPLYLLSRAGASNFSDAYIDDLRIWRGDVSPYAALIAAQK